MALVELKISKEVAAQTEDCETYIPANGVVADIILFSGSSPTDVNTACKLIWDLAGAGEQILWTIEGQGNSPTTFSVTGDGVKKLAICLDNGQTGPVLMSAFAKIEVPD